MFKFSGSTCSNCTWFEPTEFEGCETGAGLCLVNSPREEDGSLLPTTRAISRCPRWEAKDMFVAYAVGKEHQAHTKDANGWIEAQEKAEVSIGSLTLPGGLSDIAGL